MSTPFKGKYGSSSIIKTAFKPERKINGKTHQEFGKYIVFFLSKVIHSSAYSLLDKRANGSVAVNHIRVIDKHPDMTVDVSVIDNHEITSIPLVTSGSVSLTTSGEVIIIMHKHAHRGKKKTIHS